MKLIVMGVSGCGKSVLGARIAAALGVPLIEGDDHHLPASRVKMERGIALEDRDREPWLDRLGELLVQQRGDAVLTCSALKRRYRDRLRARVPGLRFVYLEIDRAAAEARVRARTDHLFPATLVASQFEALESPLGEDGVFAVPAVEPTGAQVQAVLEWLERTAASGGAGVAPLRST
ncbi:MAG: gluconokinase [Caldimonas sp.]